MVSVVVPLAWLTSVNAAVRMVPVPCAGAEPMTPVGPMASAATAAVPARPVNQCRQRLARPCRTMASSGVIM
jgi:hypothetical protein